MIPEDCSWLDSAAVLRFDRIVFSDFSLFLWHRNSTTTPGSPGSAVLLTAATMGQPAAGDGEPMEKFHIDLGDLMLRVQKLIILTQPFLCLADFLQQLRRYAIIAVLNSWIY